MTLLQPHLGDTRCQKLAILAFLLVQVSTGQGGKILPPQKKAPLRNHRVSDPIKISPFMVPTVRKEAPTGKAPMGATPHKAVTNHFPQPGGNRTTEAPRVVFRPHSRGRGRGNPSPQWLLKSLTQSTIRRSPPFFRRGCQRNKCSDNVLNIITNGYILPFISKPFKKNKLWPLVSSLFCQRT